MWLGMEYKMLSCFNKDFIVDGFGVVVFVFEVGIYLMVFLWNWMNKVWGNIVEGFILK